jgi:hypothetical protein
MEYLGYTITQDEDNTFRITVGEKVVSVGLNNEDDAKLAVETRRSRRERLNLDPAG